MTVYTGADGSITLSTSEGAEGTAAQSVIDEAQLLSVGRAQGVRIEVQSAIRPFHEIGQRYATELRAGNVSIRGSIDRAYLNGAMLRLLLGEAATQRPGQSWVQPAFNITLLLQNPVNADVSSTVTLHDVKIENWGYTIPEDDFVLESVGFQALFLTVADAA